MAIKHIDLMWRLFLKVLHIRVQGDGLMRKKKIAINAIAGFTLQAVMIIYGFVFPRLVMYYYGSAVNGTLQSISQFLGYISLLDAGVSAVIRARFYKPLADGNYALVQSIVNTAKLFYRKIGSIFLAYVLVVCIILPVTFQNDFDYLFTAGLVIIIAASTFAEYFFGISYQVLLEADQRKYIIYFIQAIIVFLNTVACIILITNGFSIQFVKIASTLLFIVRPVFVSMYCKKRYCFTDNNKRCEPIDNKWAGMGHHLAYFLHSHTAVVLLTFAKGPMIISVYSVYNMVVTALGQVLTYLTGGIEAAFGNMIAKNEKGNLRRGLELYELLIFSCSVVVFTTAAITILDFVKVYTKGITDVNYIEPVAAMLLIVSSAVYCIRRPYEALVMASGKLKETMRGAFAEAVINITISFALVWKYSITGVAIGALVATIFRTVQYSIFVSCYIIERSKIVFFFKTLVYLILGIAIFYLFRLLPFFTPANYIMWALKAIIVFFSTTICTFIIDMVLFQADTVSLIKMTTSLFTKTKI